MIFKHKMTMVLSAFLLGTAVFGQQTSGREFRRTGIHNGNLVRTVFGNWGVVGQPADKGPRGAWINDNNGYIGDVSPIIGAEVNAPNEGDTLITFHAVVVPPVSRPISSEGNEESPTGKFWGFEPVSGYLNENQQSVAMSTNHNTWPPYWPDKTSDQDDPGWPGSWNGYFGKDLQNIQQESYFVMNDNNDEEFNFSNFNEFNVGFKPDSLNNARNGLGLEVSVRGMQWSQFLAQDCIFWVYEVENQGTTNYAKTVFGMLVGTYVGVTSTEDRGEYDDDWSFFDVNEDITYTGDYGNDVRRNPNWVGEVGMVGYAFLESPGNPYDGIDNDGDAVEFTEYELPPLFQETDFDSVLISVGDIVVLIDENYERKLFEIPNEARVTVTTNGKNMTIYPGQTWLKEGNVTLDDDDRETVNRNAFDGIDNDLDGLIDENYFLHYRQRRVDQTGKILFDIVNPVGHIDFVNGAGLFNEMIDEARDDGIDNDNDWSAEYDDLGMDGVPDTKDYGEGDGQPTSGEPNFDHTDVDESDQIGLSSFDYFTPAGDYPISVDEQLWEKLRPGFFDTPSSIQDGKPISGEDGDFIYGSGYFPLLAGKTERFSIALVYGKDLEELLDNKRTVQNIYNNNYRFPPPPLKPTLKTVPGDGQVTLYWDRVAETSIDPITKINDFQGYKIYRATDPNFNDVRNITNALGIIEGYSAIQQFDKNDTISGFFYPSNMLFQEAQGYSFYLGDNTGLVHKYVDTDVENGRTYYYALVAYDRGEADKDIFPSENTKFISILPTGEIITDKNTAVVVPTTNSGGYSLDTEIEPVEGDMNIGTGSVEVQVIDEEVLTGNHYLVEFYDTSSDSLDNNGNGILDGEDLLEYAPVTTYYSVSTLTKDTLMFTAKDTFVVSLPVLNLLPEHTVVLDEFGNVVDTSNYVFNYELGKISGSSPGSLGETDYKLVYRYYPVKKSPYIQGSPWKGAGHTPSVTETSDSEDFEGLRLKFNNDWTIDDVAEESYWWTNETGSEWTRNHPDSTYFYSLSSTTLFSNKLKSYKMPSDYIMVFGDTLGFGRSYDLIKFALSNGQNRQYTANGASNFRIFDTTNDKEVPYTFYDNFSINGKGRPGEIDPQDVIYFLEETDTDTQLFTWTMTFSLRSAHSDSLELSFNEGDTLFISVSKPFREGDTFTLKGPKPEIIKELAKSDLKEVRVVPNPYISAHAFESPLPPGITSGRGERKIFFTHVPYDAEIHIYTARGQHVRTLKHDGSIFSGSVSWDLKTRENLDIAYGVYFYFVDSPTAGKQSGKFAVIK